MRKASVDLSLGCAAFYAYSMVSYDNGLAVRRLLGAELPAA